MKEKIIKIVSISLILILFSFIFTFGYYSTSESYCWIKPYIDTKFAKNYSPEKFDKIKVGMSEKEVQKIIGEPLDLYSEKASFYPKEAIYTQDALLFEKAAKKGVEGADFAWYRSNITYNENKKVIKIDKGWSFD
jgi:hypothetical protein